MNKLAANLFFKTWNVILQNASHIKTVSKKGGEGIYKRKKGNKKGVEFLQDGRGKSFCTVTQSMSNIERTLKSSTLTKTFLCGSVL